MLRDLMAKSALVVLVCAVSFAAHAMADSPKRVDIPAGDLVAALEILEKQTAIEIVYQPADLRPFRTQGIKGNYEPKAAVRLLIKGTPLELRTDPSGAMVIAPVRANAALSTSVAESPLNQRTQQGNQPSADSSRVAQASSEQGTSAAVVHQQTSSEREAQSIEEVVVTAQKRAEKLMDVPISIGTISGDSLQLLQADSLTEMAGYVPGLSTLNSGSPGQNTIVIRGISTGVSSATGALVGTYIDDFPVGTSIPGANGGEITLDLMPYDVERVEVLRGPQGTLYGANAMGGMIVYSLRKPDLTESNVQVGGSLEGTDGSGRPNYGAYGSINMPLITDTLGVRASAYYQDNAGFIDNVGTGVKDSNVSWVEGGRFAALWRPSDVLSVQATVLAQNIDSKDQSQVNIDTTTDQPVYGSRAQSTYFAQPFTQSTRLYALNINWDVRFATLTNVISWSDLNSSSVLDLTPLGLGALTPVPDALVRYSYDDWSSKFTEELRFASPQNQRLQWLIGGFFTKESVTENDTIPTYTPSYEPLPYNLLIATATGTYKERSVFGDATYQLTKRFDVTGGMRYAEYANTGCSPINEGILGAGSLPCAGGDYISIKTWLANARFHLNYNAMVYFRYATGYRPGVCVVESACVPDPQLQLPGSSNADTVSDYELGLKGVFLDQRLQLDLSAFHIGWDDIQAQAVNSLGIAYPANGGTATSNGGEAAIAYQATNNLSIKATLDYTKAYLTEDAPALSGKQGNQLPGSPLWSGSVRAEYRRSFGDHNDFFAGGGYQYRDFVLNNFEGTGVPYPMGPANLVSGYAGVKSGHWTVKLYAKNLFNNESYTGVSYSSLPSSAAFVLTQPRTIGLRVEYDSQ